jgi:hypothetical protein
MSLEIAASKGLIRSYAWGYDPGTSAHFLVHGSFAGAQRMLQPWMAYWVHSSTECELVAEDGPTSLSLTRARQAPVGDNWTAQLSATCAQDSDSFNYFGTAADARAGEDARYSLRSPPSASGQSVDLAFTPAWAKAEGGRFATDIRQPTAGKIVWDLTVKTSKVDSTVSLSWPDLSQVPSKYRLTLVDLDSGRRRYMRTTTSYSFTSGPAGSERRFQIELDSSPFARLAISPLAQMPVEGAVSISYTVSQDAAVSADIRTLTGNVVRRLTSARQVTAGTNVLAWDGRDQSGRLVSNGPYLCLITASGSDGQVTKQSRTVLLVR